jgi:hypothetical protein
LFAVAKVAHARKLQHSSIYSEVGFAIEQDNRKLMLLLGISQGEHV